MGRGDGKVASEGRLRMVSNLGQVAGCRIAYRQQGIRLQVFNLLGQLLCRILQVFWVPLSIEEQCKRTSKPDDE